MQSAQFTAFKISDKAGQVFDIRKAVKKYFYHWPLFVIGLSISTAALYYYLKIARPVYEVKAAILIQDEKKTPNQHSALSEIDLIGSAKLIENEIEILKSKQLINEVVKDLGLTVNYQEKVGFFYKDIYKSSPFQFTLINPSGDFTANTLNVTLKDTASFLLEIGEGEVKEVSFGDTIRNSFGSWKLEPSESLVSSKDTVSIRITVFDPDATALYYQKAIVATIPNKLSTTVSLSITDEVPQRGKDILNRLIYNYHLLANSGDIKQTESTLEFLDQRIAGLAGELTDAEKGIEQYKSSRGLTDISSNSKIDVENLQANDSKLNEIDIQLTVVGGIEEYVNSPQNIGNAPTTFGISDERLTGLIEKLSDLQLQRVRLLATVPETSPTFVPINQQIKITKSAINESVKNIKLSLLSTRAQLLSYDADFKSSIKSIPTKEREYINIKRQQSIKENLYTYLLQKREEVAVSYASAHPEERIVDQAYAGPKKLPQKPLAFALSLLFGLAVPAAFIFRKYSGKVTDIQQVTDVVKVPILGELPYDRTKYALALNNNATTAVSEQFRVLRTRMFHRYGEKKRGRITLVTSSLPGEGKSFVSSNLSIALAYSGRKTIILELDLRKPKIAEVFNIDPNHSGMSDFLNETASLSDIIQNSGISDELDFIGCGSATYNPSELLEGGRLPELFKNLSYIYDDIIIDSPPMRLVSDAMILARLADMTLYIVRQGVTENVELEFIQEQYSQNHLPGMHIILNGIQSQKYGYGYNYNNSYYTKIKTGPLNSLFGNFSERFY